VNDTLCILRILEVGGRSLVMVEGGGMVGLGVGGICRGMVVGSGVLGIGIGIGIEIIKGMIGIGVRDMLAGLLQLKRICIRRNC
jgi:hypothetical protein